MGKSMTTVTPSRGFSMELGTATSVLVASYIKIPVSTTQVWPW
jgi:phosphate/sulfate permease